MEFIQNKSIIIKYSNATFFEQLGDLMYLNGVCAGLKYNEGFEAAKNDSQ
jgi:hypothetical protein